MTNDPKSAFAPIDLKLQPPRRRLRRWFAAIVLLAAALSGWWWLSGATSSGPRLVTANVGVGQLEVTVSATGSVQPRHQVEVSSELSGTIRQVLVDFNDKVEKGQPLALLDTSKLEAEVANSRAKLLAAQARVQLAQATFTETERDLARKRELAGVVSQRELDATQALFERAKASLASARADVDVATAELQVDETNLARSCICSPISGVVLKRTAEPGMTVASSLQAPVLFSIAEDLASMEVQVAVDEADIGVVKPGQKARFRVDAYPGRKFEANVREVRFASEVVQGVVTYMAILGVDNSQLLLRPGMTATAEILTAEISDALLIPNAALRFTPPEENPAAKRSLIDRLTFRFPARIRPLKTENEALAVWVPGPDGQPKRVEVTLGPTDGRFTQVLSGLKPGDSVITDAVAARN